MQRRLIVDSKWTFVNGCLSLCVGTVSDWWHVQVYPVSPNVSWDRTQPLFAPLTSDTTAPLQKTIKQEKAQRSHSLISWPSFQKLLLLLFLFAFCLILAKWVAGPWLLSHTKRPAFCQYVLLKMYLQYIKWETCHILGNQKVRGGEHLFTLVQWDGKHHLFLQEVLNLCWQEIYFLLLVLQLGLPGKQQQLLLQAFCEGGPPFVSPLHYSFTLCGRTSGKWRLSSNISSSSLWRHWATDEIDPKNPFADTGASRR